MPGRGGSQLMGPVTEMASVWLQLAFWLLALGSGSLSLDESYRRQVTFEYNPGWDSSMPAAPNVLHIRALGPSDTIHYLWSSLGAPTVLQVYSSSPNSTLHVDWSRLQLPDPAGAIRIEPAEAVVYSTAVIFSRLLEYDDENDTADMSQVPADRIYPPYQLQDFTWADANATLNQTTLTAQLQGCNATGTPFVNGTITFRITAFEGAGRDADLPRLFHTANTSKLEFVIEGLQPRGNRSRFGLELMVLEEAGTQRSMRVSKTIDDEYTPSIFKVTELVGAPENGSSQRGFLQWKPVAYGAAPPLRSNSMQSRDYGLRTGHNCSLPTASLAFAFGRTVPTRHTHLNAFNVSFGSASQWLYPTHHHISWSVLVGHGAPPEDTFSVLVVAIMAVGLGLPAVLLLVGGVYVCIHRSRLSHTGYQPIN
ncbi:glycosylated lysosomal membrane protein [Hypanus sabinus]|uniref:glycosylated lysosomal membrane protein n=1 Tax=Hypanus sabinus TaxID=79690 RepID=UPI0028C3DA39|nr:glycosylated lysosomal membrane protein [Hypanus sabinus]